MRQYLTAAALTASALCLAGCQGVNAPESHRGLCVDRAYDQGFCQQPSNFYLSNYLATGRG